MSLAQRMHFLLNVFQMTAIALVSVIDHIHGSHLFWDIRYVHIKTFAKNEKESETLIQMVRMYNQDIGMEFSFENVTCW